MSMKYYLLFSFLLIVGVKSFAQKTETAELILDNAGNDITYRVHRDGWLRAHGWMCWINDNDSVESSLSNDTVKCIMIIYSKVSSGYDSLAHARFSDTLGKQMERGWVIVPHGTPIKSGSDIDAETAGYLLQDKRPTHKHVAKAVYFNWK